MNESEYKMYYTFRVNGDTRPHLCIKKALVIICQKSPTIGRNSFHNNYYELKNHISIVEACKLKGMETFTEEE